jgi:type IV pilus assembly protein PilB
VAKKIGELLVQEGLINQDQLDRALAEQKNGGDRIGAILIRLGFVSEELLTEFIAKQFHVPEVNLGKLSIPKDVAGMIPADVAVKYQAVPFGIMGNTLNVAMSDPGNLFMIDDMRFLTRKNILVHVASETAIKKVIGQNQSQSGAITADLQSYALQPPNRYTRLSLKSFR